jgi:release factor glutamine methyltransferase
LVTIAQALRDAAAGLTHVSDTPRLDAELLMAHALGIERDTLLLKRGEAEAPAAFDGLIRRRLAHEPTAYITGQKAFWTLDLTVTPAVLIPRPDSETLIEAAIDHFRDRPPARILDLGTGSGALLLAALDQWPLAQGVGVDASPASLEVARDNAERLGFGARSRFVLGDWQGDPSADLILCNPPYIAESESLPISVVEYEPASALFAGADGLDDYRRIAAVLDFAEGGAACIEIGSTQAADVGALFASRGFSVVVRKDLAGLDRCVVVTRLRL